MDMIRQVHSQAALATGNYILSKCDNVRIKIICSVTKIIVHKVVHYSTCTILQNYLTILEE
jgi:hypothetical protein